MRRGLLFAFIGLFLLSSFAFALDIVIDAQRDDFYNTLTGPGDGWLHIPYTANNDNNSYAQHDDEYDLSANFWCAWDETYLYFYEEVWDDYVTGASATNHQNDCLEIKFDADPTTGISGAFVNAIRLTALDSFDTDGPMSGVDNMYPEGNADISGLHYIPGEDYARMETDLGYNLEGRLPWEHIYFSTEARGPVVAAVGEIFGMAIMNHENDSEDTERNGSIEWASHMVDGVWNQVDYHGTVTFLEGNKLQLSTENFITGLDTNTVDYTPENVAVNDEPITAPVEYQLSQNYPNPFNPVTNIAFSLPTTAQTSLVVYDLIGNEVANLVSGVMSAGNHVVQFDAADLPSGIYFYKLQYNNEILANKMMLVK